MVGEGAANLNIRKRTWGGLILLLALVVLSLACFQSSNGPIGSVDTADNSALPAGPTDFFVAKELLGLPTDQSITVKAIAGKDLEAYIEYGPEKGKYPLKTKAVRVAKGEPFELVVDSLKPDTEYYYRMIYGAKGEQQRYAGEENSFHTQRKGGSSFTFTVQADSHRDENVNEDLYRRTLQNIRKDNPDFHIDLGDTFMTEKFAKTEEEVVRRYIEERGFFDTIGNTIPLFLVNGNHEGENGWWLNGKADNLAVWASNARNKYYLNPKPNAFYSGNGKEEKFVGARGGYYAWEWGDALFVVLDPFWNTTRKSSSLSTNWNYTLGKEQYDWFRNVLEKSQAKFKFVFSHNVVGGSDQNGRGGLEAAKYYEWGGFQMDGTYAFDQKRPGWGKPIHQLMVDNKVTVFFHGHDHFFAKQDLDGVVYQLVPQPGNLGYNKKVQEVEYGYIAGVFLTSSGHLRVTVSGGKVTVDYVRSYLEKDENKDRKNGETGYSYEVVNLVKF